MKFFLDTADVAEIRTLSDIGLVDGVTTNPTLVARSGRKFTEVIAEICKLVSGPVSAEVTATDFSSMMKEAKLLQGIAPNVTIKVPMTADGLKACRVITDQGGMVNVTLVFSASQALLAAKAGAAFVSPFVGRLDDISHDGLSLIDDIVEMFQNYPALTTEVLVASIRSPLHVVDAARRGADVATMPAKVMHSMMQHPLTDRGLEAFLADWAKTGQSIVEVG